MNEKLPVLRETITKLKKSNESLSDELLELVEKLEKKIENNEIEEIIDAEAEIQEFLTKHKKDIEQEISVETIQTELSSLKTSIAAKAQEVSTDTKEEKKGWLASMSDGWKRFWKWTGIAALSVGVIALVSKFKGKTIEEGGVDNNEEGGVNNDEESAEEKDIDQKEIATGYIDPLRGKGKKIPNDGFFRAPRIDKDKKGNVIGKRQHNGLDISAHEGTLIYPAMAGVVEKIGRSPRGGNSITLKHPNGDQTKYLHLKEKPKFPKGTHVNNETVIGLVGNTGVGTGPHLHFEVIRKGLAINPGGCCDFNYREEGNSKGMVA